MNPTTRSGTRHLSDSSPSASEYYTHCRAEAKKMTRGRTPHGEMVCSLANAHGGEAPQEAIDMSVIRDIDLEQGGEYVLLKVWCGKS
jgi:hypothetical protein